MTTDTLTPAVRHRGQIYSGYVRHRHIISELVPLPWSGIEYGFLTDAGEFLSRQQAAALLELPAGYELYSEDLW